LGITAQNSVISRDFKPIVIVATIVSGNAVSSHHHILGKIFMNLVFGSLSIPLAQCATKFSGVHSPFVENLPVLSAQIARVHHDLIATQGTYGTTQGGTLSVLAEWVLNGQTVHTGPTYTPRFEDLGGQLIYHEIVTETGGLLDVSITVIGFKGVIEPATSWDTSVIETTLTIHDSPGTLPAPEGVANDMTVTFSERT